MIHLTNGLLGLGLIIGSAAAWTTLPETIPVHFGITGEPDRWAETSFQSWFALPLLGLAMAAGMYLLGRWIPLRPEWINLPHKERYLALDPEEREPVHAAIRSILHSTAAFLLALFCLIQVMIYREAQGLPTEALMVVLLVVVLTSGPMMTVIFVVRAQSALERAWKRHRAR